MSILTKPVCRSFDNGDKIWSKKFNLFSALVFVPKNNLPGDVINFGYSAPCFYYFTDSLPADDEAKNIAINSGLSSIAAEYDTSVIFILPNCGNWKDKIWGISGDEIKKIEDKNRNSILTLNYFKSTDGNFYTVFGSVSGMGHECRYHTCENAWLFMSEFRRNENGIIEGGKNVVL